MKQSIYSLILGNLKKMLVVTLGVSATLILLYTAYSFKQTQNQAAQFVMKHVELLAQSGVTSQTVGEVDQEVAKFFQTWKETQDLDLRIDIFLNDRHISHAGQLQSFGKLSTTTEKSLGLPSGDTLRVLIQMDLTGFILYGLILLTVLEGAIVALFYILSRSMQASVRSITQPLESKVAWLKDIASDLPKSARATASANPAEIAEIDDLGASIKTLTRQIVVLEDHLAQVNFDRGRLKMAEKIAHTIKGTIATFQLRAGEVTDPAERRGLNESVRMLSDMAADLLESKKLEGGRSDSTTSAEPIFVLPAIQSAVLAKCQQYRDRNGVKIEIVGETNAIGCTSKITYTHLQTILINLIDNSVEALPVAGGCVVVELHSSENTLELNVRDNGRGIPEHILPSLMVEGFSYGKKSGNGIGLSHAKEIITEADGTIIIESKEGVGTIVTVRLPLIKATAADIQAISIQENMTVVCVDDDTLIHGVWDKRIGDRASIVHLHSVQEFEAWIAENGITEFGSRLYLFDYDLKNEKKTGLDLIYENALALESVLVSGMVENPEVKERATKLGLRRLSKDFLAVVPIHVEGKTPTEGQQAFQTV